MISVIVAIASNGVIGSDNQLIWHISEDLRRFKSITTGHPVVMGRRTFESLGRPLPNRVNVVITRNPSYVAPGVTAVNSLDEALGLFADNEEVFVIGGAQVYSKAMPIADKFYLTEVKADYKGDVYFPQWNPAEWNETFSEYHDRGEKFESPFIFKEFVRKNKKHY